jgi:hypothetical protein
MADPKWRLEILPSVSILMNFSNGAVFRSLITNLVLVFKKKKWRIQNGDYNITFRVSVNLGLMSLKNCNLVR